jgi:hypothetical protein
LLGFLIFGRSWWGSFLAVGLVVLLALLLASNAYLALGLAFALLLVAVAVLVTGRSRMHGGAAPQSAMPSW